MPKTERVAVARVNSKPNPEGLMLDSGTTAHMTPHSSTVQDQYSCDVNIPLGDDSIISAKSKGVRKVRWQGADGPVTVSLTDTLVAPDAAMSLLSVPALAKKEIAVLFLPDKAILFDLKDNNTVLGYAKRANDDIYYINDNQDEIPVDITGENSTVRAFMAVATNKENPNDTSTDSENSTILSHDEKYYSESEPGYESNSECESVEFTNSETTSESEENLTDDESSISKIIKPTESNLSTSSTLWHIRLGHVLNQTELQKYVNAGILPKVTKTSNHCEVCFKSKFRKQYKGSLTNAAKLGHLHADTKGKIKTPSENGDHYFVTVVDEFSRSMFAKPIPQKSDASKAVQEFITWFERQSGRPVCSLHTDGGSEIFNVQTDLKKQGTEIYCTTAYTHQSNGLAERCHGIILAHSRAILHQSNLPTSFWNYAILHSVKCKNLLPHCTTGKIPYEMVHGHQSNELQYIRPFGCRMLYHPVTDRLPTFKPRLYEGICLGHDGGGVYIILTVDGIIRTKYVKPFEEQFPGLSMLKNNSKTDSKNNDTTESDTEESDFATYSVRNNSNTESTQSDSSGGEEDEIDTSNNDQINSENYASVNNDDIGQQNFSDSENNSLHGENNFSDEEGEYADITHIPEVPSTYRVNESDTEDENEQTENIERPSNLRQLPRVKYNYRAMPKEITTEDEPKLSVALKSTEKRIWLDVIKEEFDTLEKSNAWVTPKSKPPQGKVIPSAMIFKLKRDENGLPARFKGRLVALGNFQSHQLGLVEVYGPDTCIETVRILFAVAYCKG